MKPEDFINNLKRDKARGNLAPHQLILLIALSKIYDKNKQNSIDISVLNRVFQEVWCKYQFKFKTTNNKMGLPLKAFINKEIIIIETNEEINDYRNYLELESKITDISMDNKLLLFLNFDQIEKYLVTRITE